MAGPQTKLPRRKENGIDDKLTGGTAYIICIIDVENVSETSQLFIFPERHHMMVFLAMSIPRPHIVHLAHSHRIVARCEVQ